MGYALVGLASGSEAGVSGVALYMLIYMVMTLGTFACIMAMRQKEGGNVENIDDLAGLSTTRPFMAFVLTALMFSLAGIPPLAGFFAKYFVFVAAIEAKLYALAIIGVVASVIGAYYYLRVVKVMYFDAPLTATSASCCWVSSSLRDFSHWMRCSADGIGLAAKAARCRAKVPSSWLICCWLCCR
mgnify:CR=1 FL=1